MTKWKIRKLARAKIEQGLSRQQAYEEIVTETGEEPEKVAKSVRFIPSLRARNEYKNLNLTLGFLILLATVLNIIGILNVLDRINEPVVIPLLFIIPVLMLALALGVFQYRAQYYPGLGVLGILSLSRVLRNDSDQPINEYTWIGVAFALLVVILAFYLAVKLGSNYTVNKVKREVNGKTRVVKVIKFPDEPVKGSSDELLDDEA